MITALAKKMFGSRNDRLLKQYRKAVKRIGEMETALQALSDEELQAKTPAFKQKLAEGASLDQILEEAFAVCREASRRVLGMRHFDVQLIGGMVLHQGKIAEMRTGEGKTLVATLAVYLNALAGKGVHVVTVNDYLAARDAGIMAPLYNFLGLSVGVVVADMDHNAKQAAYQADITYGTNNEFGFDYLRDNMVHHVQERVQRELNFAVVDEVDSILIDEARTPLIISGQADDNTDLYVVINQVPGQLVRQQEEEGEGDYWVDEKNNTVLLSEAGHEHAEEILTRMGLLQEGDSLYSATNIALMHHLMASLRAHSLFHLDQHYVVQDGEIVIVDEFTGRLMSGRRWSEGLHQAVEAKEGVEIRRENQTLASITFQNYFRLYHKLAGMTGTADTEAFEFQSIYNLETVIIPTNRPMVRKDHNDQVFRSAEEKYEAVVADIEERHAKGQPILVGTTSIENSELVSELLNRAGLRHSVLNAKEHAREADIVAQAGKVGMITVATNMAGRGTDIVLGGNIQHQTHLIMSDPNLSDAEKETRIRALETSWPEEHEKVLAAGGLHIVGTERHESRRIDNQLRGRAGRQGDAGASRFFISLEDDLMRLFGGDRVQGVMDALHVEEDMPIENKMITGTIESAQKKLEARNFSIRKNVLQFDDVMNSQREIIYGQRSKVLQGEDVSESVRTMIHDSITGNATLYLGGEIADEWDFAGLRAHYLGWLTSDSDFHYTPAQLGELTREDVIRILTDRAAEICKAKEAKYGSEMMREIERVVLLRNVDTKWMEHIDAMDELRKGIYLRSYGQHDPVVEYRIEGFNMFDAMVESIREDTTRMLLTIEIKQEKPLAREQVAKPTGESGADDGSVKRQPVKKAEKIGRNDPCPCGSGVKWKKCTCEKYHPKA